jgi:hypothetical protein
MRPSARIASVFVLSLVFVSAVAAQGSVDVFFGAGSSTDKSNGQAIDTFGTGALLGTPALHGVFLNGGASVFINRQFGFGGELSFRPNKTDYAGLLYRPLFYDFNGIWKPPLSSKRIVPEVQGGLGGVNLRFYTSPQFCDAFAGCVSSNTYIESSNHFQVHVGGGVRFYVTRSIFVRPQFDLHWVHNFFQFSSNFVPEYGVSMGYTLGGR